MMNGVMTSQRMDYHHHSVSQGRTSVPPTLGKPWYPDTGSPYPPRDSSKSLLLDIPSMSPRPPTASKQHLLTVATPTPPTIDPSVINPELRQAQKTGDVYNISVNLNALQLAARPSSAAGSAASMRRAQSMQNLQAAAGNWSTYRPPSTTPVDDQEPRTTVVQVRHDVDSPVPVTSSTLQSTSRRTTKRVSRSPSIRTLRIPPSPGGRRSRSASRASAAVDEGYIIKSLKSTTDENLTSSRPTSTTRLASSIGDGTVVFDVELTKQQQQRQQQQMWEKMERSSSQQHVVNSTSSLGRRSLVIESVTPSGNRPLTDPRDDLDPPTYTMTMNQQMTMNYEPPLPPPPPRHPDIRDETVRERTVYVSSSDRTGSRTMMTGDDGYLPDRQVPTTTATRPKKKKKPKMVNSATQMAFDKSTQVMQPTKTRKDPADDEPVKRSKRPITKSAPPPAKSAPEPEMVSRATQMAVNKSTQVKKKPPKSEDDDDDDSDLEPQRRRKVQQPPKRQSPEPSPRTKTTDFGVQVATTTNESDLIRNTREVSEFDRQQTSVTPEPRRGPGPVNGYENRSSQDSEEEIQPQQRRKNETTPNWQDNDEQSDSERPAPAPRSSDMDPRGSSRQAGGYESPYGQDTVDRGSLPPSRDAYEGEPVDEDKITPGISRRNQAPPNWCYPSDVDDDDPDNPSMQFQQDTYADRPDGLDGLGPGVEGPGRSWYSATEQRSDEYSGGAGNRSVPVMSSSAFDDQDEAYLRQRRAYNVSATRRAQPRSGAFSSRQRGREEARALLARAEAQRANNVETHFGYEGSREAFVQRLMRGAPKGSVTQWEHTEREEEEIVGPLSKRFAQEHGTEAVEDSFMLNFDTVSEKVELSVAKGMAEMTVRVRCERIVPVRGAVADLFKKTSVIVTRVIEVDLAVTTDRQQLYDHIIARQRQSMTGRLSTTDTFDLYKTFVAMAEIDEAEGRQRPHEVRIDQQVDEQRLIDLQLSASRSALGMRESGAADFRRVDGRLPAIDAGDVDFRSRAHQRPVESAIAAGSVMAASRSRQLYYQS